MLFFEVDPQDIEFSHTDPYEYYKYGFVEEDFVSDSLGKRIGPDVGHIIFCLETAFNVQQRNDLDLLGLFIPS